MTKQWIDETIARTVTDIELVIAYNGMSTEEIDEITNYWAEKKRLGMTYRWTSHPDPLGSTKPLNMALGLATGEIVAAIHNDLIIKDDGWDLAVIEPFKYALTGVVGFHGSKWLGHPDLYRIPYELIQLARGDNYSNLVDAESHGHRITEPMEVVTLDGMGLVARKEDLLEWGGFNETYIHHMYDHDLCLTARWHGRHNYVLPISVQHLSGQTANFPKYNEQMKKEGREHGDVDVHRQAHIDFYERWRNTGQLPARLV